MLTIPIEVSARHIHLSQKDLDTLFGVGYQLTPIKDLSQHGQYAAEEVVEVQTKGSWGLPPHRDFTFGKSCDHNQLRILGPVREETQVELSWSDSIMLGIEPRVLVSGDLKKSQGGIILVGPKGEVKIKRGVIIPQRHIHCNDERARRLGMRHGQIVSVRVIDDDSDPTNNRLTPIRQAIFFNVIIRTHPTFDWHMHLDTDEGNAAGIKMRGSGEVLI